MPTRAGIILDISAYHALVFSRTYLARVFFPAHMILRGTSHLPTAKATCCHNPDIPASSQPSPVTFYSCRPGLCPLAQVIRQAVHWHEKRSFNRNSSDHHDLFTSYQYDLAMPGLRIKRQHDTPGLSLFILGQFLDGGYKSCHVLDLRRDNDLGGFAVSRLFKSLQAPDGNDFPGYTYILEHF